jgi:hypothetical protein
MKWMRAATRLQAQEQRVREYQALLDRAVADKLNIEQHMASCGLEAAARIGGCDELPAGGDCFWQRERQCTFNHQLPSSMALQLDSWCPANGRENCGRSTPLTRCEHPWEEEEEERHLIKDLRS